MTEIDLIQLFARYGVDAALFGVAAALTSFILKHTLLKKAAENGKFSKLIKLLPYILGVIFYFIYDLVCNGGAANFLDNPAYIIERGLSAGTLGFILYLTAEKIVSGESGAATKKDAVKGIISGYISGENEDAASETICAAAESGDTAGVESALESYILSGCEGNISMLKALILKLYETTE